MDITQVKIFPVHEDKLKAFVSIVFDHCFMINDIKVIQGRDGLFLSMPSRRKKNGEFKDVAHPLNNDTRRLVEERVLAEYWNVVDDPTPRRPVTDPVDQEPAAPGVSTTTSPTPDASVPRAPTLGSSDPGSSQQASSKPGASGGESTERSATESTAVGDTKTSGGDDGKPGDTTLEEVEERHLRDSYWTVT